MGMTTNSATAGPRTAFSQVLAASSGGGDPRRPRLTARLLRPTQRETEVA
jgi:hypothetical protein